MKLESFLNGKTPVLTDSGFETTLIYHHNIDLPHFAAFYLLDKPKYQDVIYNYYISHLEIAKKHGTGFILESGTWRANKDWAYKLGYDVEELIRVNILAINQLKAIREEYSKSINPIYISGQIGPSQDGYIVSETMTTGKAKSYHELQISAFKKAGADLASAQTICYINEAMGIVKSAKEHNLPVAISFTVETDGNLPSGESLKTAIESIDNETDGYPLHYMINCAHPSHFINQLDHSGAWQLRIKGIRANASCKSHAELDEATELDSGNIEDFGKWHKTLKEKLPNLIVYGGCCGTDVSHIEAICNTLELELTIN